MKHTTPAQDEALESALAYLEEFFGRAVVITVQLPNQPDNPRDFDRLIVKTNRPADTTRRLLSRSTFCTRVKTKS